MKVFTSRRWPDLISKRLGGKTVVRTVTSFATLDPEQTFK